MTYRGHIKGGVVVLDAQVDLPDGTEVEVQAVSPPITPTVWQKLLEVAGTAEGLPEDAAVNLDHYLYGSPKR
jgi:hypothetical protein